MRLALPLLLLFTLLATVPVIGQLDREALERDRMRENRVSECIQYTHRYQNGVPSEKGYKTTHTHYNPDGNPTLVINYRSNGKESSRLYYEYDEQGRRVEYRKDETLGDNRMKLSYKQTFTYDARGNKKTEEGFDGTARYKIIYNYLPNGKLADLTRYNADNTISERWIYTYRGDRQIIRVTPQSGQPYSVERTYDGKDRLLRESYLDSKGTVTKENSYTYDAQGRVSSETAQVNGKPRHTLTYQFNRDGQLSRILCKLPDSEQFVNNNYTYDGDGNLVTEQWVDGAPDLVSQKDSEFNPEGDMVRVESYYAPYKYRVMYSYEYKKR